MRLKVPIASVNAEFRAQRCRVSDNARNRDRDRFDRADASDVTGEPMRMRQGATTLVLGGMLISPSACGGSSTSADPSADQAHAYVSDVNKLCATLLPKVIAARHGGHKTPSTIAVFLQEQHDVRALAAAFDRQVAAVPVPAGAKAAAAAFRAYQRYSDGWAAQAEAAAATGKQSLFVAEMARNGQDFSTSPVVLHAKDAGFSESCSAR